MPVVSSSSKFSTRLDRRFVPLSISTVLPFLVGRRVVYSGIRGDLRVSLLLEQGERLIVVTLFDDSWVFLESLCPMLVLLFPYQVICCALQRGPSPSRMLRRKLVCFGSSIATIRTTKARNTVAHIRIVKHCMLKHRPHAFTIDHGPNFPYSRPQIAILPLD